MYSFSEYQSLDEGKKKGLWDNIHAKRKRGEKPAKPGDKDYPETLNVEGYAPGDVDQKVGAVTAIPKKEQDAARERIKAKTAAKRAARLKETAWDQVDIFAEMNDWEISLLNDTMIEDIITDVFIEELQEGRDIDSVTDMLCESVDYSLNLLTEVSDFTMIPLLSLPRQQAGLLRQEQQTADRNLIKSRVLQRELDLH